MEKVEIRPLATPKSLNRSPQKLALDGTQHAKFCSDRFRVSASQLRDLDILRGLLCYVRFFGGFVTRYYQKCERIVTQNTV